jgi:hypothetical protein
MLFDYAHVTAAQTVLIHGAAGNNALAGDNTLAPEEGCSYGWQNRTTAFCTASTLDAPKVEAAP